MSHKQGDQRGKKNKKSYRNRQATPSVYIVDTNILLLWAFHIAAERPGWADDRSWAHQQKKRSVAAKLFTRNKGLIVIPPIVWVELYGVYMQKDVDIHDYLLWRRKRKAALAPIEQELFDSRSLIILGEELLDSELAVELCRLKASPTLLQDMQKHYGGKVRGDGSRVSVKCLDGLDSAILAYAWRYAQRHPDREVRLVSDDIGLRLMIEELHRSAGVLGESVPFNLGARNLWGRHYPEALNMSQEQSTSPSQPKTPTPTPKPPNANPKSTTSTARQRPSSAQSSPETQTPAPSSESSEKTASKKCEEAPTSDVEATKKKPTQKSTPSSRKASAKS